MMPENSPITEIFNKKKQGVAAAFFYDGQYYGIPLQKEDVYKFEAALRPSNLSAQPESGHMSTRSIGLVGGKVEKKDDSLDTALKREISEELGESLNLEKEEIISEILPQLQWHEPKLVEDLLVIQALQREKDDTGIIRGSFEIYVTTIQLNETVFNRLKAILKPLNVQSESQLRPFLYELRQRKYFE